MQATRILYLSQCCLKKYLLTNIREIRRPINWVRYSSFLESERCYELGNFEQDLKPFLKTRKKRNNFGYGTVKSNYGDPIIISNDPKLNHHRNQIYDKFKPIPLASQNWKGYKSIGDRFTISISKELKYENNKPFQDMNLNQQIIDVLKEHKIETMSEIQEKSIPVILSGRNSIIAAETGCGKTLAYVLPILEQVLKWKKERTEEHYNSPFVIILTPSRELTNQIRDIIRWFKKIQITCQKALGGHVSQKLMNPTVDEVDILVATIGIINKIISLGLYNLKNVRHVVLDEADALLDDSFNEITVRFLKQLPIRCEPSETFETGVQLTLVSATMPTSIDDILGGLVEVDRMVKVVTDNLHKIMPHVPQQFLRTTRSTKPAYLLQIVKKEYEKKSPIIIFCNKSETCDFVSAFLEDNNVKNLKLTGELKLKTRKNIFNQFQEGEVNVLVSTSIAARGLDTTRVRHVLNYDFPSFISDYIHRCGRTGRLGSNVNGKVTNIISGKNEIELVQKVEKSVRIMTELENVNSNIPRIIAFRNLKATES